MPPCAYDEAHSFCHIDLQTVGDHYVGKLADWTTPGILFGALRRMLLDTAVHNNAQKWAGCRMLAPSNHNQLLKCSYDVLGFSYDG